MFSSGHSSKEECKGAEQSDDLKIRLNYEGFFMIICLGFLKVFVDVPFTDNKSKKEPERGYYPIQKHKSKLDATQHAATFVGEVGSALLLLRRKKDWPVA